MIKRVSESFRLSGFAVLLLVIGTFSASSAATDDDEIVIAAFGDSLSAGYQLPPDQAFPVQLEAALKKKGLNVRVLNAAVSGDTTTGGLARLDWSIGKEVDAVILELGANDALRGVDPSHTRATLDKIVQKLTARDIKVLVTGMEAPRGFGAAYVKEFRQLFVDVAKKYDVLLYPFFLEGIALEAEYNLGDGMHPNGRGVQVIVENILPSVEKLIEQVRRAVKR